MGDVLAPVYPDNLRAAAALGRNLDRFVDAGKLTAAAYTGLDFYAPVFFPAWNRSFSQDEVLNEALSWASRNNQCASMAALVTFGADVNANAFRGTPLLWACYADKVEAATWLLDHGADPDLRHDWGGEGHGVNAVAMHLAAQNNCVGCVNLLLGPGRRSNYRRRGARRRAGRLGGIWRRDRHTGDTQAARWLIRFCGARTVGAGARRRAGEAFGGPRRLADLPRQRHIRRGPGTVGAGPGRRAGEAFGGPGRLADLPRQRHIRRGPGTVGAGAGRRAGEAFGGPGRLADRPRQRHIRRGPGNGGGWGPDAEPARRLAAPGGWRIGRGSGTSGGVLERWGLGPDAEPARRLAAPGGWRICRGSGTSGGVLDGGGWGRTPSWRGVWRR